jgi:hypothetical protein
LTDEERSMCFDAHEDVGRAWQRFEREPNEASRAQLKAAVDRLRKTDIQLLQNFTRNLGSRGERDLAAALPPRRTFWWERD